MYILFGTKFSKIFCGPMWTKDPTAQGCATIGSRDPLMVCFEYCLKFMLCSFIFVFRLESMSLLSVGAHSEEMLLLLSLLQALKFK